MSVIFYLKYKELKGGKHNKDGDNKAECLLSRVNMHIDRVTNFHFKNNCLKMFHIKSSDTRTTIQNQKLQNQKNIP